MKALFLLLLLAGLSGAVSASDKPRDWNWVLEQYERKELYPAAKGRIDGAEYLAFMVGDDPDNPNNSISFILVFRKTPDRSAPVATINLQGDYSQNYEITIKNNSVYLGYNAGHPGRYNNRYQFRQIGQQFRLTGIESQFWGIVCGSGDKYSDCDDIWSGESYNLLTSSAIIWQKILSSSVSSQNADEEWKDVRTRFDNFLWPKNAVTHKKSFRSIKLPLLDGFDFYDSVPEFNYKNKLKKPK